MPDLHVRAPGGGPAGAEFSLDLERVLHRHADDAFALWEHRRLGSAFQPIVSLAHQNIVGYEGLLRATSVRDRQPLSAQALFAGLQTDAEVVYLDRLCRALHVRNAVLKGFNQGWLFLNIDPNVVVMGKHYGPFFTDLLARHDVAPQRVVVEVVEGAIADEEQLADAVNFFRDLGCLVAIDDFGAGHSNFERIWRIRPDIVKLDRSFTVQISRDTKVRRILGGLVGLIHEAGSLVVMEGIEDQRQALMAMDADVDLAQGYFFGRPAPVPSGREAIRGLFLHLEAAFGAMIEEEKRRHRVDLEHYMGRMAQSADLIRQGRELRSACQALLDVPGLDRCYLLDHNGAQVGDNIECQEVRGAGRGRFDPLADTRSANWSRRPYFRRAMGQPGRVQMTRPYLSARDARYCLTLSIAFDLNGARHVLCADLEWDRERLAPSGCDY
jgi:EAL domain-containing protein (putative c-di-GMP-specific phosphodiesterase class I)